MHDYMFYFNFKNRFYTPVSMNTVFCNNRIALSQISYVGEADHIATNSKY